MDSYGFVVGAAFFMLLGTIFTTCGIHAILLGLETSRSLVGGVIWGCVLLPLAFFLYAVATVMLLVEFESELLQGRMVG